MRFKKARISFFLDILADIVGSFFLSIGIHCFSEPAQIAPGGVSGLAILINYLSELPIGLLTFFINIPLVLLSFRFLGKGFTLKTLKTIVISTIMLDFIVAPFVPIYMGDRLLSSIFGGVLMGLGLGFVFLRGSTTGGTDILSFLIQRKFPHIPIGQALMVIDAVILLLSILVFGNFEAGMFGVVALFVQTKVIDGIVYGEEKGNLVFIISTKHHEIAKRIIEDLERSATLLSGYGAYSHKEMETLVCAVRKPQFAALKKIVHQVDENAFVIVTEASQILGEGFHPLSK